MLGGSSLRLLEGGVDDLILGCDCCVTLLGLAEWTVCGLKRHEGLSGSLANW